MISCLLLSAGFSSRFGSPKALALLNQKTVIEHLQQMLLSTSVDEIIVVLGNQSEQIKPLLFNHKKIKVVHNKDYKLGQTSSFKCGLKNIGPSAKGVLLVPVDYPWIRNNTIEQLINYFSQNLPLALIPAYQNKKGHPPVFNLELKNEFLALNDSAGINEVFHHHPEGTIVLPVNDPGVIKSFNTKEEFERIKEELS